MKTFLEYVAEDLIEKHGTDLSQVAVIFPNKRAQLFLNEHLAQKAGRPIWSPSYMTISDLFRRHSSLEVADNIQLVARLHKSFTQCTGSKETLDHFYGWGELLLADFDDIDKNMADAGKVLANVSDLHQLDDLSYLSEEQLTMIRQFFSCFTDEQPSEIKKRFLFLWQHIYDIYLHFNQSLSNDGLAYEGSLYRSVASSEQEEWRYQTYVFVGFNMVHPVEQALFSRLKAAGKAMFYWDFDYYYLPQRPPYPKIGHEAGHYISQLLSLFPNELDNSNGEIYQHLNDPDKECSLLSAPTNDIAARYINTWLQRPDRMKGGRKTAIVLCDESLLPTAIHCFPQNTEKVNITTGYPIALSTVYTFVNQLYALQVNGFIAKKKSFRKSEMNRMLRHPLAAYLSDDERQQLFVDITDDNGMMQPTAITQWLMKMLHLVAQHIAETNDPFLSESIFRCHCLINRLQTLLDSGEISIDIITLQRLLIQLMRSTTVPFHGEPAVGLQLMGVLETRNLDFDHLLILSCNEGNMPKGLNDTSFIPYSIRKAHGLTTIDNKVAIYSYYFHRMIQRAKDITVVYNSSSDNGKAGELSRFMLQLMVESNLPIHRAALQGGRQVTNYAPAPIEKTPHVMEQLERCFRRITEGPKANSPRITPTAVNRFRRCELQFYYYYVLGLPDQAAIDEEAIDQRTFGNIFHEASQIIYEQLLKKSNTINKEDLERLLKNKKEIVAAVDEAFKKEFKFDDSSSSPDFNGLQIIHREVIITYLRRLLRIDMSLAPFTILGLEKDVVMSIDIYSGEKHFPTTIGGRIDRLDLVEDKEGRRIRVIDYKTGTPHLSSLPTSAEAIFKKYDSISSYYLQAFLYSHIVRHSKVYNRQQDAVSPALLFIQHTTDDNYDPTLKLKKEKVVDIANVSDEFFASLINLLHSIFDTSVPFHPTLDKETCKTCNYRRFCGIEQLSNADTKE